MSTLPDVGPRTNDKEAVLSADSANRLFTQGLHEDTIFNERLNFFLVFESVLLGTVATIYSSENASRPTLLLLSVLGMLITIMWMYIQRYQNILRDELLQRMETAIPDFGDVIRKTRQRRGRGPRATLLLTYGIPGLVFVFWAVLLVIIS